MQNLQDSFFMLNRSFFNFQDFTFKACKQSFDSSFSLCVTISKPLDVTENDFFQILLASLA